MPEGFRFPAYHRYWVPLRLNATAHEVGAGPEIQIFGRLAADATLEHAQAELTTIGRRMAAAYPETHEHLRPWIRPYTRTFIGIDSPARAWLFRTMQVGLGLLLVVVSMNVAILGVVPAFTPPPPFEPFAPKLYQPLALAGAPDRTGRPAPGNGLPRPVQPHRHPPSRGSDEGGCRSGDVPGTNS